MRLLFLSRQWRSRSISATVPGERMTILVDELYKTPKDPIEKAAGMMGLLTTPRRTKMRNSSLDFHPASGLISALIPAEASA